MKIRLLLVFILGCSACMTYASHQEKSLHTIQFGGTLNTGNSETTNLTSKITSEMSKGRWSYEALLEAQQASSQGVESARSLKGNGEIQYHLSHTTYFFTKGSLIYDKYATFDFIGREVIGWGRILLHNKTHELSIEAGPGAIHRRIAGTQSFQNEPLGNITGKYIWHLSDTAEVRQTIYTDIARLNTHVESSTALRTKVVKNLALELSFDVRHDTQIPARSVNTKKTDTATKATLVYTFH